MMVGECACVTSDMLMMGGSVVKGCRGILSARGAVGWSEGDKC